MWFMFLLHWAIECKLSLEEHNNNNVKYIPVDKCPLGIHQIKFMIQTCPGLSYCCSVTQHAHSSLHLSQIWTRNNSGRLKVDAKFEPSWAPVHKLDCTLGLDGCYGRIDILWNNITPEDNNSQFSVLRMEYRLGGSSKKVSHVYFLLQVFWVII